MEHLRLILILIGAAVLAVIWLTYKPRDKRQGPAARRREPRIDTSSAGDNKDQSPPSPPDAQPEQPPIPELNRSSGEIPDKTQTAPGPGAVAPEPSSPVATNARTGLSERGSGLDHERIVTLYLRTRGERRISGLTLLDAAIKAGLRYGEMKIFHRRHQNDPRPVFSMANITRPGFFDPSGWNLLETPGVTLFMTLPGPVSALDAWDAMLAAGQRLSGLLDADLLDDRQCLLTRQRIAQIREEMRHFDREHGLGAEPS